MGSSVSHMNVWALSCVIRANVEDVLLLLQRFEESERSNGPVTAQSMREITEERFLQLMRETHIHPSDAEVFVDFLRILDVRSRGSCSLPQLLVAILPFVCRSIPELFSTSFIVFDRTRSGFLDKAQFVEIVKLIGQTCSFVGDKPFATELVYDLINSTYTSLGKIDGEVFYQDLVEFLALHPIVQLYISQQFQGSLASKVMTYDQIDALCSRDIDV